MQDFDIRQAEDGGSSGGGSAVAEAVGPVYIYIYYIILYSSTCLTVWQRRYESMSQVFRRKVARSRFSSWTIRFIEVSLAYSIRCPIQFVYSTKFSGSPRHPQPENHQAPDQTRPSAGLGHVLSLCQGLGSVESFCARIGDCVCDSLR